MGVTHHDSTIFDRDVEYGGGVPGTGSSPPRTAAEIVVEFLNTRHVELDREDIPTPAALRDWATQHGLGEGVGRLTDADVAEAHRLREALRDHLSAWPRSSAPSQPAAMSGDLAVGVDIVEGRPVLTARGRGWPLLRGRLLLTMTQVTADGDWSRVKVCPGERCAWAFLDRSKNTARTWCSDQVCGTRTRSRAYRDRRRGPRPAH
jgi:predicted RNA-binding Zn ribbon-like protein